MQEEKKDHQRLAEELAKEQKEKLEGKALSIPDRFIYSAGNLPAALTTAMIDTWVIYFYAPPAGKNLPVYLSASVAGLLYFLGRVSNAIGDPVVGFWSDRTRIKWGRRRPFILFGTPLLALFFILLWFPPVNRESLTNAIVLGFYMIVFWFLYPVVVNPYLSMLPEISPFLKERINVSALMGYAEVIGRIIGQVLIGFAITYVNKHSFAIASVPFDGYKVMAVVGAFITLVIYVVMVLRIKETPYEQKKEVPFGLFQAVVEVFKNPSFIPYIVIIGVFMLSSQMLIIITPYFGSEIMKVSEDVSGMLLGIILIVAALFFPVAMWAGGRFGKKNVFSISMLWFAIFIPLFPIVKLIPEIDPKIFAYVIYFIIAPPISTVFVLQRPMISDVIDYDEKLTGYRRESMYMGAEGLITKLCLGIAGIIVTQLMRLGNTAEHPWGILLTGPVACAFLLIAIWYYHRNYPFRL